MTNKTCVAICLFAAAALSAPAAASGELLPNHHEVKNVIMMVPDGMGLSDVTATRIRLNGPSGAPLYLETLEHIGYQRTYSEKNTITDSSAAASAWACGEKFVNNEVCFHADGRPHNQSLLELAKASGMATGLVATQTITHATPASFASHVAARKCETEIARQYITETQPDVLLGGGQNTFKPALPDACGVGGDYIAKAAEYGYAYASTQAEMENAVQGGVPRLLGLFAGPNLTPEYLRTSPTTQPRLPDMTRAALRLLERNRTGFFLMVEGSLIDSANHEENPEYQTKEMAAFDESVKAVLDWMAERPERGEHTLVIVLADHETGGYALKGSETPGAGLGPFTDGWTFIIAPPEKEAHHTGVDTMIWSQGPGSEALARPIENTTIYQVVKEALRF